MTTSIVNPGWILEVIKHAGNETPEAFDLIIHKRNAFDAASVSDFSKCSIEIDFSNNRMLQHLKKMGDLELPGLTDYFISRSQMQAYHWQLSSITTKLLNMAYVRGAHLCYRRPMADLNTILVDSLRGERAAKALHVVITNFCHNWRTRTQRVKNKETALKLFDEILANPFPVGITDWAAFCCCWRDFTKTDQMKGMSPKLLYRIGDYIKQLTEQATDVERKAFDKLLESLDRRTLKRGKTKDYSGFIGVVRDLERRGKKITKITRGIRRFCADKIFKELAKNTENDPYQFQDFCIFISERLDTEGDFFEPVINQIHPDQKTSITLSKDTFQKHTLSKITPA